MIELVPVIEIVSEGGSRQLPPGSRLEFPEAWDQYHRLCHTAAGFSDALKPYSSGSPFYRTDELNDGDLCLAMKAEIRTQQGEEEKPELYTAFYGGYVFRVDGRDLYFPQCCGTLADIRAWEGLLAGNTAHFYCGHPSPAVSRSGTGFIFDFVHHAFSGEHFVQQVIEDTVSFREHELRLALAATQEQLSVFAARLLHLNESENLHIPDIEKWLIRGGI